MSESHDKTPANFVTERVQNRRHAKGYTKIAHRIDYVASGDALAEAMADRKFFTVKDIRRFNKFGASAARRLATHAQKRGLIKVGETRGGAQAWVVATRTAKQSGRQSRANEAHLPNALETAAKLAFIESLRATGMNAEMLEAIHGDIMLADKIRKLVG